MATQPSHSVDLITRGEIAGELAKVAEQAREITSAAGAAIAVSEGSPGRIRCRASSGPNAPDVGTAVDIDGTLTGICIASGRELLCHDTETDTRVDSAAARALGIRSILVTPIQDQAQVSGVLAVFAVSPHAFRSAHVAPLRVLANRVSTVLQQERIAIAGGPIEPPVCPGPAVLKMVIPAMVEGNTAAEAAGGISPTYSSDEGKREDRLPEHKWPERKFGLTRRLSSGLATVAALQAKLPKFRGNKLIVISAIAVVLVVLVTGGVLLSRWNHVSPNPAQLPQKPPHDLPAQSGDVMSKPVQPKNVSVTEKIEGLEDESNGAEHKKNVQLEVNYPEQPAVSVSNPRNAGKPLASPIELEDVIPDLRVGPMSASDLSLLAQPPTSLPSAVALPSDLVKAKLAHAVTPIYPNIAKVSRISGAVTLQVVVGKDGKATNPKFIKGPIVLRDAAWDAVKQWIFQPAMLHGRPVEQEMQVTLSFKP